VIPAIAPLAKSTVPIKKYDVKPVAVIADPEGGGDDVVFSIVTT
jgi:hypothetical protein